MVTLTAGGAVTGFSFVPATAADLSSPTGVPVHLMALENAARPSAADDAALRTAIVNVSHYYLRLAKGKSPAQMRAMIWQKESPSGVDHGATCAAFASLTLEMAAQAVGRHSWVSGGSTYPYPLYDWADVRVEPNSSSPRVMSVLQDARAHHRWHPLGDGYQPMPGDWVLFNGHMEVVTGDEGGLLRTIGANSLPNYTVNAHEFPAPLATYGVIGFVNNGTLPPSAATDSGVTSARDQNRAPSSNGSATQDADGGSSVPGFEVLSDTGRADPPPPTPVAAPLPSPRTQPSAARPTPQRPPTRPRSLIWPRPACQRRPTRLVASTSRSIPSSRPRPNRHKPRAASPAPPPPAQPGQRSRPAPTAADAPAAGAGEAAAIPGAQAPLAPADPPGQAQLAFGEIADPPATHATTQAKHHARESPAHTQASPTQSQGRPPTASQPATANLTQAQPGAGQAAIPGQATAASQPAKPVPRRPARPAPRARRAQPTGPAQPATTRRRRPSGPPGPAGPLWPASLQTGGCRPRALSLPAQSTGRWLRRRPGRPPRSRRPQPLIPAAQPPAVSPNGAIPNADPAEPSHHGSSRLISVTTDPPVHTSTPSADGPSQPSPPPSATPHGLHQRDVVSSTPGASAVGGRSGQPAGPQPISTAGEPTQAGSGDPVYVTTDPPVHLGQTAAEPGHRSLTTPMQAVATRSREPKQVQPSCPASAMRRPAAQLASRASRPAVGQSRATEAQRAPA